jgi:hypothetical protein
MTKRMPQSQSPVRPDELPPHTAAVPGPRRGKDDPMAYALIRSQVALATANAILLALIGAYEGAPDSAVPDYVREARAHLAGPQLS